MLFILKSKILLKLKKLDCFLDENVTKVGSCTFTRAFSLSYKCIW